MSRPKETTNIHLLRAEQKRLKEAVVNNRPQEEINEIQERVTALREGVQTEIRRRAEERRRQRLMEKVAPRLFKSDKVYECPKCHRKWRKSQLNYYKKKGKKIPWCPICHLQIYPCGDERLKHPVNVLPGKYPKTLTFVQ